MRKIPTLFQRDPNDLRHVTRDVHPDCRWVLDGEGERYPGDPDYDPTWRISA